MMKRFLTYLFCAALSSCNVILAAELHKDATFSGTTVINGTLTLPGGTSITATTGTGSIVLSNSPTLTGTPVLPSSVTFGSGAIGNSGTGTINFTGSGNLTIANAGNHTMTAGASGTILTIDGNGSALSGLTASQISLSIPGGSTRTLDAIALEQMLTPKDFGAAGNGTTDDYTALQAALTSGKSIYFPAGQTFRSSHSLAMSSTTGQMIQGGGEYLSRIVFDSGSDGVYPGGQSQSIRDVGIVGTGNTSKGIVLGGPGGGYSNNFQASRVYLQFWDLGFSNENGWDGSGINDSKADSCNTGIYTSGNQDRFKVEHCNVTFGFTINSTTGCDTTSGSATVACTNTTGVVDGRYVTGNGIPAGTTIVSHVTNTSLTLSANATQTITSNSLTQVYGVGLEVNGSGSVEVDTGVYGGVATPFKLSGGGNLHVHDMHIELSDGLGDIKGGNNAVAQGENNYFADPPNTNYVHAAFSTGTRAVFTHNQTASAAPMLVTYSGGCDIRSPDFSVNVFANANHHFCAGPWLTVGGSDTAGSGFWPAAAETNEGMVVTQISDASSNSRPVMWQSLRTASATFSWQTINATGAGLTAGTAANNLVQLDGSGRLPAVDGSQLTGLGTGSTTTYLATLSGPSNRGFTTLTNVSDLTIASVPTGTYLVVLDGGMGYGPMDAGWKWDLKGGTAVFGSRNAHYNTQPSWMGSNYTFFYVGNGDSFAAGGAAGATISGNIYDGEDWTTIGSSSQVAFRYTGTLNVTTAGSVIFREANHSGSGDAGQLAHCTLTLIKQ